MKAFYEKLQNAEKASDDRMVKLAQVCKADLKVVQEGEIFEEWSWWTP